MGKRTGIITETTVDLPAGVAKSKNITLIPSHILINEESRLHGIDIVNQEVIELIEEVAWLTITQNRLCMLLYFLQNQPMDD